MRLTHIHKKRLIAGAVVLFITVGIILGIYLISRSRSVESESKNTVSQQIPIQNKTDTESIEENNPDMTEPELDVGATDEVTEQTEQIKTDPAPPPTQAPDPTPPPAPAPTSNWWDYPATIAQITLAEASAIDVIVDKGHQLPSSYVPSDIVALTASTGLRVKAGMSVRSVMLDDLRALGAAAKADGVDLVVISSYRSYTTQQSTYNYWVSYNGGSTALADQVSARPGHSEHQLGTVVDFSTNEIGDVIGASFNGTAAAAWLNAHAGEYGFRLSYPAGMEEQTGYAHESWHWRWWGR